MNIDIRNIDIRNIDAINTDIDICITWGSLI